MVQNNSVEEKNQGDKVKSIIDSILKISLAVGFLTIVYYFLIGGKTVRIDRNAYKQIDSLNNLIQKIEQKQFILYTEIKNLNSEIETIDGKISNIKTEKIIIKEKYNEKIKAVDTYSDAELDSIFSTRYPRTH